MKGERQGNRDVSYANNMDSELSKPFEQKGLKYRQRRRGPVLERSHFILQPPAWAE